MKKRVAVTGMGIVCSAGTDIGSFAESVSAGKQCFHPIADPRLSHLRASFAGLVPEIPVCHDEIKSMDRFIQLAAGAADQALAQAGVSPPELGPRMGLVFATCSGPMLSIEDHYARILEGSPAIGPDELFYKRYYSGASVLAALYGISGFSTTITTACSAGVGALGMALDLISGGRLDVALVGGADSFSPTTVAGFDGLKATCETTCAPFSKPIGLNLGEGGAFVVVESLENAHERGAQILAEVLGYGLSNDAYHCSAPDPSGRGQSLSMKRALAHAHAEAGDIEYVNAHGTGTGANDKAETKAIMRTLGDSVPVSSTKSMVGHCLGAAGMVEVIASILCGQRDVFPSTGNFSGPREGCTLDYVPDVGRPWIGNKVFMSNSFAFGGNNASTVITVGEGPDRDPTGTSEQSAVCITACGVVTAAGPGVEALRKAVESGNSLAGDMKLADGTVVRAACVPKLNVRSIDRRLDLHNMDSSSRYATVAAKLALIESGRSWRPRELADLGFYMSLSAGPSWAEGEHISALLRENFQLSHVNAFPYIVPNSVAGNVSRALMLTGHNTVFCGGPGSGLTSLVLGAEAIRAGHADALLCGAVDELSERVLSDAVSAGWLDSLGVAPAEGAAMLLLENESVARGRGAKVLARIEGFAFSTETSVPLASRPDSTVLRETIRRAMDNAGIGAGQVGIVCCRLSENREVEAAKDVLGVTAGDRIVDISPIAGYAESSFPLANLAYVLAGSDFGKENDDNYILTTFASPNGVNSVVVLNLVPLEE